MRQVKSKTILGVILFLATGCGQVGLEKSSEFQLTPSPEVVEVVEDLGPGSGITNALQLLDPQTIDELLEGVNNCEDLATDYFSCLLIKDSFERESVTDGAGAFAWSSLVDDVAGSSGDRVEADIYNETQLGMTPEAITGSADDMGRSVLFTGRPGGSVHSIFLVSKPLDVANYNSVFVGFEFLAIDLETWTWDGKTGNEHIRLEVCESDLTSCGVLPALDETGLNSANWVSKYQSPAGLGDGLSGHNHVLSDWTKAGVNIDITSLPESVKSNFVFRITVTIDEGFLGHDITGLLEDGIALDNVVALASNHTMGPDTEAPPVVDEPTPNGPSIQ